MRIFKTKWFSKWAKKERVSDTALRYAVSEMEDGLIEADLGGFVYKKRIHLDGRGKRGGARTLLAYKAKDSAFFIYGFAKNERVNITGKELKALKLLATDLLNYSSQKLQNAINAGEIIEVNNNG